MKSLAIEREFGSGGREVGMKVAALAGIPYYDSALMVKAAEANGISVGMLEEYDEKRSGSFLYDLAAYTSYAQGGGKNSIYELFSGMQKTIEKLATEGQENRENYTGGSGYYLSGPHRRSGWTIRKESLKYGLPRGSQAVLDVAHWLKNFKY